MMKKFFIKGICMFLAIAIVFIGAFVYIQSLPRAYGGLIGSIREKNSILATTPSPRVIVVGGSSAPYSVDGAMLEKELGIPCINVGATAYFGLEFYLEMVRPELKSGDIVILAPEFNIYCNSKGYDIVWCGVENDFSLIKKLPLSYLPGMAASFFEYAQSKLSYVNAPEFTPVSDQKYFTDAEFTMRGDITTPRGNILEKKYNTLDMQPVTADELAPETIKAINRFLGAAAKVNATVYFTAAPLNRLSLNNDISKVDELEEKLLQNCTLNLLGHLRDGIMSEDLFFNSNLHLNSEGQREYTARLLKNIKIAVTNNAA